jgi:hypothetical protein
MLTLSPWQKFMWAGLPLLGILTAGTAQAANLTVGSDFVQSYGNYLLTGSFQGLDEDDDGILRKSELTGFSLFFNSGDTPIFQTLDNLNQFSYTIGSDTVTKIVSASTDVIAQGEIDKIDYSIDASTPSLLVEQSSIAFTTHYSDGRTIEGEPYLTAAPIQIGEVVPLSSIPEGNNVAGLLVLGGVVLSIKRFKN